jgi:hypothetical protein
LAAVPVGAGIGPVLAGVGFRNVEVELAPALCGQFDVRFGEADGLLGRSAA